MRDRITSEERDRIKVLEREVKELRRANEILMPDVIHELHVLHLEPHNLLGGFARNHDCTGLADAMDDENRGRVIAKP